jgi:Ca2+-binding RTX toxin-like protein
MPNTLSDKTIFAKFLQTVKVNEQKYRGKSTEEKQDFFRQTGGILFNEIGLPPVEIQGVKLPRYTDIGEYRIQENRIYLNSDRLASTSLSEFQKVASVFYHEMRHAEQAFRAIQHYVKSPTSVEVLSAQANRKFSANIRNNTTNSGLVAAARSFVLPENRKEFARNTFSEYLAKYDPETGYFDGNVSYEQEPIEKDGFVFQRESYRILTGSKAAADAWYKTAFDAATPISISDPSTFNVVLPSVGTPLYINGVEIKPIPIKHLNRQAVSTQNSDNLSGDIVLVAGTPMTQSVNDLIEGQGGNDTIHGINGDDYLYGNTGNDAIRGGNGNDYLDGGDGNDSLTGDSGDDVLYGKLGNDTLNGGAGNDTYYVDSFADVIQGELISSGKDSVYSSISLNLGNYIENLILVGEGNITGAGNGLDNLLFGNNKINIINGLAGNDQIYGLNGNDTLKGGDGNDYLNGDDNPVFSDGETPRAVYVGADRMEGGTGNDTYIVNSIGDVVFENAAEGIDTVISSISYNLGVNLENLVLSGIGNITGAGNTLNNSVTGNDKVNILNGLGGNDTIYGEGGNDRLIGDLGDDILCGGSGNDTLTGGNGFDRFAFGTPGIPYSSTNNGIDTFVDFQPGVDKIQIQRSSFTAITTIAGSTLKPGEFALVTSDAAAATSSGLIVYNQATGNLFYNSNGTAIGYGTGGELATLSNRAILAASNIVVI